LSIPHSGGIRANGPVGTNIAGAGFHIKTPTVERADDLAPFEHASAQGSPAMRTKVIHGKKLPLQIENRKLPAFHMNGPTVSGSQALDVCHRHEFAHGRRFLQTFTRMKSANPQSAIRIRQPTLGPELRKS
jgi:hypothetical protein